MTDPEREPIEVSPPGRQPSPWPPALLASSVLGAVGALLLLAGLVTGTTALVVAATAAGTLSLGAALVWRSQLIRAWHDSRRPGEGPV